jgi:hypothetical protein
VYEIAQQISHAFGVVIDKDVVRRVLAKHYRPGDSGTNGPSWLTFIGHAKDSLWSIDLFRRESIPRRSHWYYWSWTCARVGWSVSASNAPILTGSPSAGCSITPSLISGYQNMSVPITTRCSVSTVGLPTLTARRRRDAPAHHPHHPRVLLFTNMLGRSMSRSVSHTDSSLSTNSPRSGSGSAAGVIFPPAVFSSGGRPPFAHVVPTDTNFRTTSRVRGDAARSFHPARPACTRRCSEDASDCTAIPQAASVRLRRADWCILQRYTDRRRG